MKKIFFFTTLSICVALCQSASACTGITLKSKDNATVVARTVDWSGSEMNNLYTIAPRGHHHQ